VSNSSGGFWRKSENDGPVFKRSENVVAGLGWVDEVVGGGGSLIVVARRRFCGITEDRVSKSADVKRRRAGGRNTAIVAQEEVSWEL
jgi:hypothetical protein